MPSDSCENVYSVRVQLCLYYRSEVFVHSSSALVKFMDAIPELGLVPVSIIIS